MLLRGPRPPQKIEPQRPTEALDFLARLRPRASWTLISEGGQKLKVDSFSLADPARSIKAASWIAAAQTARRGVLTLIGDAPELLFRAFTMEDIISTPALALSFEGDPRAVLAALPEPSAIIHTGAALAAIWQLRNPAPMAAATPVLDAMIERTGAGPAWIIPVPGTRRADGAPVKTLRFNQNAYEPKDLHMLDANTRRTIRASDVEAKNIEWLWKGMIPSGTLINFAGPGAAGKTTVILTLAAILSRGGQWPDGTQAPLGDALIFEYEDSIQHTTTPRLKAAGADLNRITLVEYDSELLTPGALDAAAADIPDLRLVVLSPVRAIIQDNNISNVQVRDRLGPLMSWAERRGVAMIGILHPKKDDARLAAGAIAGSAAYTEQPRMVWMATVDEDNPAQRTLSIVKCNIAPTDPTFGYTIETTFAGEVETSRIVWDAAPANTSEGHHGAQRIAGQPSEADAERASAASQTKTTFPQQWLAEQLGTGPRLVEDLEAAVETTEGISRASLYRAAKTLGVTRTTDAQRRALWAMGNS